MSAMLSPGVYLRCSENSTENPWNGLACNPAMKPSTMNRARRSSRETWRITSGFRYFSAVLAKGSPRAHPSPRPGFSLPAYHTQRSLPPLLTPFDAEWFEPRCRSARLRGALPAAPAVVLGDFLLADLGDQAADQALGGLPLGLGLEVGANPVPEHGDGNPADV